MITKKQLQNIFKSHFSNKVWQDLLINLFGVTDLYKEPKSTSLENDINTNDKVDGYQLGELKTTDHYTIGLFVFEIKGNTNIRLNRVGLRSLVHSYIKYGYDAAIAVYYDSTHWRLSFICDLNNEKTAPKRFTYVFGNSEETYHTAASQLLSIEGKEPSFTSIKEAFSVEKLSKDFFNGYKTRYEKFCNFIGGNEKWQRDYVKKMMGRLVFLQFLQKKGWMGVPADRKDWIGGDLQYTQHLIQHYNGNDRLLSDILEPLFFDTLNNKRNGDIADSKLGDNIKIPYLNGGLFDKDSIDQKDIDFPYEYFADLFNFFSEYNFTIDENDPYDSEIGIDPEMLGRIFENLLEDNRKNGTYYTPKEIVQYMSHESIAIYLKSRTDKILHKSIDILIKDRRVCEDIQNKSTAVDIYNLLKKIRICDPAIGSGAFPMGILNVLFHSRQLLYGFTEDEHAFSPAEVKRDIIQNNIFGVDIEQGAVDIARLRFWLALVVDEIEPHPLPNLDYKIVCGNSLLSRYELDMPLNDVFREYNKSKKDEEKMSLGKYKQLVADYTNTYDHTLKDRFRNIINDIKKNFCIELSKDELSKLSNIKGKIKNLESPVLFGEHTQKDKNEIKKLKIELAKLEQEQSDILNNKLYTNAFEWRFEFPALLDGQGNFIGFDIVIGNPPYVDVKALDNTEVKEYFKKFVTTTNRINLYSIFIEQGYKILNNNGVLCYINPNSMLLNSSYLKLRELIFSDISAIIKLPDNIFEYAIVETIIFLLVKNAKSKIVYGKYYLSSENADLKDIDFTIFNKQMWRTDIDLRFNIFTNVKTVSLIKKIEENSVPLVKLGDFSLGITPYDKAKGHSKEFIKSKGFHATTKLTAEYVPLIKGSNIYKYCICGFSGEYLKYCKELGAPRQQRFFTDERIIIRQILSSNPLQIIAAYSNTDHYFTQIGFSIIPKDKKILPVKYLLSILNSKLMNYYHKAKFLDSEKITFPKILIENCKQFPIRIVENTEPFIDIVNKILDVKYSNPQADISIFENEIDLIVYKLYGLTYDDVLTIDPKTPITKIQYGK